MSATRLGPVRGGHDTDHDGPQDADAPPPGDDEKQVLGAEKGPESTRSADKAARILKSGRKALEEDGR